MNPSEIDRLSKEFLRKENERKAKIHLDKLKSILARTFPIESKEKPGMGSKELFHGKR